MNTEVGICYGLMMVRTQYAVAPATGHMLMGDARNHVLTDNAVMPAAGIYIVDIDGGMGLYHMVYEVVDNTMDAALVGAGCLIPAWVASVNSPIQTVIRRSGGDDQNR